MSYTCRHPASTVILQDAVYFCRGYSGKLNADVIGITTLHSKASSLFEPLLLSLLLLLLFKPNLP